MTEDGEKYIFPLRGIAYVDADRSEESARLVLEKILKSGMMPVGCVLEIGDDIEMQ